MDNKRALLIHRCPKQLNKIAFKTSPLIVIKIENESKTHFTYYLLHLKQGSTRFFSKSYKIYSKTWSFYDNQVSFVYVTVKV